jgi:hypothetical protein
VQPATKSAARSWSTSPWAVRPTKSTRLQPLLIQIGGLDDAVITADAPHRRHEHVAYGGIIAPAVQPIPLSARAAIRGWTGSVTQADAMPGDQHAVDKLVDMINGCDDGGPATTRRIPDGG